MIYTEEQWRIIKQASPHYESARHEYIRNAPRFLTQQVIDVYEAATGKTVMHKDLSCAVCVLNIYKQIGKTYFTDLEEREKIELDNDKYEQGNAKSECRDTKKKSRNTGEGKKGKKQEQNS